MSAPGSTPQSARAAAAWEVRTTDGVRVAVHGLGGEGRPVLFVHANGFHSHVFSGLARELAGDVSCFGVDLRGHGSSGVRADLDFSWDHFVEDVFAATQVVAEVAPAPAGTGLVGFGHSVGGAALLLAEARRPGTFAGIYCYEPIVVPRAERRPPGTENPLARGARARRDTFASRADALAHFSARPLFAHVLPSVLADYVAQGTALDAENVVRLVCRPEYEARIFEAAWASSVADRLGEVRCPVRIAVGARSADVGRRWALAAAEKLADVRTVEIVNAGHLGPLEVPATVAASVRAFVAELAPTPGPRS